MIKAKDARIITKPGDIVLIPGMRNLKYCASHCTAGPRSQSVQEILTYWEKHNGWKNPGYHYLITEDGTIYELMRIDKISNGIAGRNSELVNICCTGGVDSNGKPVDNRTAAQIQSHLMIIGRLKQLLSNLIFLGHRDFSTDKNGNGILEVWEWIKACPGYDFRSWLKSAGIDKQLIPAKIVYKFNTPNIKNQVVGDIQIALRNWGFYKKKIDDFFGEDTSSAVMAFQKFKGLPITGVVDSLTAKAMGVTV
jgi:N-acetylmuramoyl-L-alanine amidase